MSRARRIPRDVIQVSEQLGSNFGPPCPEGSTRNDQPRRRHATSAGLRIALLLRLFLTREYLRSRFVHVQRTRGIIVDMDGRQNARVRLSHRVVASINRIHDMMPIAFDCCAHRVDLIVDPLLIKNLCDLGNIFA